MFCYYYIIFIFHNFYFYIILDVNLATLIFPGATI